MKIGFVGYGNMASAIVNGILQGGSIPPEKIYIYDHDSQKMQAAKTAGLQTVENLDCILNNVNTIFICVKPKDFSQLLISLKPNNNNDITYVSIAAGIKLASMQKVLGDVPIVRAMPNTPLMVGRGTTALCHNGLVPADAFDAVKQIFATSGSVYSIEEANFDAVLNLNGSSPAYIYQFAKCIAEYTVLHSTIPLDLAVQMLADTLQGAGKMLKVSGKVPEQLIQDVSSPGGTTVAALQAMQQHGLNTALESGCAACIKRAGELSG